MAERKYTKNPKHQPNGRSSDYQEKYCDMLIEHMAEGYSFESFAANVGVCFQTLYNWEKVHVKFLEAKSQGLALNLKYYEGIGGQMMVGKIQSSPSTFIFMIKNRFPKLYRDRQEVVNVQEDKVELSKTVVDSVVESAIAAERKRLKDE